MLRVGTGKSCINPTPNMFPLPAPMHSDWGVRPIQTSAIYNDISVRALAVDNGDSRILFVVYECPEVPGIPDLTARLAEAAGYAEEEVFVAATHNHTGINDTPFFANMPMSDEERASKEQYKKIELQGGIEAVRKAVTSMRSAHYGFGTIDSYINTNRDLKTLGGYWVEGRNLAGYSDKTLSIIKFIDDDGKLIAALLNHPTHATCCYLMQDVDHLRKTSGNFNSIACQFVEEHYANDCVCLWTSGCAGDQNPLLSHGMQYEYPDGWTSAVDYPDGVGYMHMELIGRTHGADAVRCLDTIVANQNEMPIHRYHSNVGLPSQKRADNEFQAFRMGGRGTDRSKVPYGHIPKPSIGPKMIDGDEPVELKMQLLTLGKIAILGVNAEPYCMLGTEMKEHSPLPNTFIITHTDQKRAGYILDKASADHKVFQAFSMVKPGSADDLILECERKLFAQAGY
jgi:neutral ceramidase